MISFPTPSTTHQPMDQPKTDELLQILNEDAGIILETERYVSRIVVPALNSSVEKWAQHMTQSPEIPSGSNCGIRMLPVGSRQLGVLDTETDVDVVLVAPKFCTREDFFGSYYWFLKHTKGVHTIRVITAAKVPLIKCQIGKVEIDILFGIVESKNMDISNIDLRHILSARESDYQSILSLNAYRISIRLLECAPSPKVYSFVLHAIKKWAKNKGMYSNLLGFVGGVTLAIMVSRICQEFKYCNGIEAIGKFFEVYSQWNWENPVELLDENSNVQKIREPADGSPLWKIANIRNKIMIVKTPTYPQQSTTSCVTLSAHRFWQVQVNEAHDMFKAIVKGSTSWERLFIKFDFFGSFDHFLYISLVAANEEEQNAYVGFLESKIRLLVAHLDETKCLAIAHLNINKFKPLKNAEIAGKQPNSSNLIWVIGLKFTKKHSRDSLNDKEIISYFANVLNNNSNKDAKVVVDLRFTTKPGLYNLIPQNIINNAS